MPEVTAHVILTRRAGQDAEISPASNDLFLDLTHDGSGRQALERRAGYGSLNWHPVDRAGADVLGRSTRHWVRWLAEVGRRETSKGSLLRALAYDERYSLYWSSQLAAKHLEKSQLAQAGVLGAWLEREGGDEAVLAATAGVKRIRLYGAFRWTRAAMEAAVARCGASAELACDNATYTLHMEGPTRRKLAREAKTAAQIARELALGVQREGRRRPAETPPPDVAVFSYAADWIPGRDGAPAANRYWGGVVEGLQREGFSTEMWPAAQGAKSLSHYQSIAGDHPMIRWDRLRLQRGTVLRIVGRLTKMRLRARAVFRLLSGAGEFEFCGIDFAVAFKHNIEALTGFGGLQYAFLYEGCRQSLEAAPPKAVLYRDEFYPSGRAVRAAIPEQTVALGVQHGSISRFHMVYFYDESWSAQHRPGVVSSWDSVPLPDSYVAYGAHVYELMTGWSYPGDAILPAGSLRHDVEFERAAQAVQADPTKDRPRILVCGSLPAQTIGWISLVREGLDASGHDAEILIKPHWQFPMTDELSALAAEDSRVRIVDAAGSVTDHFPDADVLIVESSTTGMEAAIFDTPLIAVLRPGDEEPMEYVSGGVATAAWDGPSMAAAIDAVLADGFLAEWRTHRDAFLARTLSPSLGNAIGTLAAHLRTVT